jgi:hypothetical protein
MGVGVGGARWGVRACGVARRMAPAGPRPPSGREARGARPLALAQAPRSPVMRIVLPTTAPGKAAATAAAVVVAPKG